jgi:hypothetical protein
MILSATPLVLTTSRPHRNTFAPNFILFINDDDGHDDDGDCDDNDCSLRNNSDVGDEYAYI